MYLPESFEWVILASGVVGGALPRVTPCSVLANSQAGAAPGSAIFKWAEAKGYTIIREYEDRAISGTTADRPGYQQMLAEVSTLRPSALILWKADRLGRERFEVALARKTIADAGCRVCYVAEAVPDDDSPEAALMESMLDGMADYYSKQLARNIRRGVN